MYQIVDLPSLLQPYAPQVATTELIEALNRHYHACEAHTYDRQHAEIRRQLPPLWQQMIRRAVSCLTDEPWRVLDFGCGTGFEAAELLQALPDSKIAELWCYDPSPEMLERCRAQIAPRCPTARFTHQLRELRAAGGGFHLLLTNSVLHHLPSPWETLDGLASLLAADAVWICGHEPSARYYRNPACGHTFHRFLQDYRRRRLLSPSAYWRVGLRWLGLSRTPAETAARRAHAEGLFRRRPPAQLVARLVDFHVPHSRDEARRGRGFDFQAMAQQLADSWRLIWTTSYSFLGPFYEGQLAPRWRAECARLRRSFPLDGANFCALWQRHPSESE